MRFSTAQRLVGLVAILIVLGDRALAVRETIENEPRQRMAGLLYGASLLGPSRTHSQDSAHAERLTSRVTGSARGGPAGDVRGLSTMAKRLQRVDGLLDEALVYLRNAHRQSR